MANIIDIRLRVLAYAVKLPKVVLPPAHAESSIESDPFGSFGCEPIAPLEPVYDLDQRMQCKGKSPEKAQHRQAM